MKLIEHVYAVKNLLSRGPASDDYAYSNALIAHYLGVVRAKLIERKIDKYHFISEQSYQDWCADLVPGNYHDCCGVEFPSCTILKSVYTIPNFLNSRWGNYVKVTDLVGDVIPQLDLTQLKYSKYGLVKVTTSYFIHNNHLFILSNNKLVKVLVNALYQNPEEVITANCNTSSGECVDYLDSDFPIDADLVSDLYALTLQMLSVPNLQDQKNDGKDNTAQAGS